MIVFIHCLLKYLNHFALYDLTSTPLQKRGAKTFYAKGFNEPVFLTSSNDSFYSFLLKYLNHFALYDLTSTPLQKKGAKTFYAKGFNEPVFLTSSNDSFYSLPP